MSDKSESAATPADWGRLIEAVAVRRDLAAFEELFEYFAPRVKTFIRRSGAGDLAAEEVAQETLLAVWRKASLFNPAAGGAAAWIFTIARNLRIDAARRERRAGVTSDIDAEFVVDESPRADSLVVATQSAERIRRALDELSEEQMRVIELSFYEEKAHAEIAAVLRIPLGTVKSRLRLAMTKLRSLLGDLS